MNITEQNLKDAVNATIQGMVNWIKSDETIIQDKTTKQRIDNAELENYSGKSIMDHFIAPELAKKGIIYNSNNTP